MALDLNPVLPAKAREQEAARKRGADKPEEPPSLSRSTAAQPEAVEEKPARATLKRKRTPAKRASGADKAPAASKPKLAVGEGSPYEGQSRRQMSVFMYPSLWAQLEGPAKDLAQSGSGASAAALFVALLHFHMPPDGEAAVDLARRFRLELAGIDGEPAFGDERPVERSVRIFDSQRERLERLAGEVRTALDYRYSRMLLANAILAEHVPEGAEEAALLLRAFELARLGESQAAEALLGGDPALERAAA